MSERPPHPDGQDADDASPTVEIVEGDTDAEDAAVVGHAPTSQGLGFDAIAYLAGIASEEAKRMQSDAKAEQAAPPSTRSQEVSARRQSSRAPEQPRQTLPTLSSSHTPQKSDRPPLSRISTPSFGDIAGALAEAEAALTHSPNDVEAERLVKTLRARIERAHAERLAPLDRVVLPVETASFEGLAHDARFLAEHVDGRSTIAELVDASGMTRLDAMRVLVQLAELGVVRFR